MNSSPKNPLNNPTATGYANRQLLESALSKLDYEELDALAYACYRTAEKLGTDRFSLELFEEEED